MHKILTTWAGKVIADKVTVACGSNAYRGTELALKPW